MSWKVEFDEQRRWIFLMFWLDISEEDVQESSATVSAMMRDNHTRKILTDFTKAVSLAISTLDIFFLPKVYKTFGQKNFFTEAIVAPKDHKIRKDLEFYETICVNRGINARVFEDRDRALEWLSL